MSPSTRPPPFDGRRVLVLNPVAGDGNHVDRVSSLAAEYGFDVRRTDSGPDISATAKAAAEEADVVAVAGGDGTLTRAVRGFEYADAFPDTLFWSRRGPATTSRATSGSRASNRRSRSRNPATVAASTSASSTTVRFSTPASRA